MQSTCKGEQEKQGVGVFVLPNTSSICDFKKMLNTHFAGLLSWTLRGHPRFKIPPHWDCLTWIIFMQLRAILDARPCNSVSVLSKQAVTLVRCCTLVISWEFLSPFP